MRARSLFVVAIILAVSVWLINWNTEVTKPVSGRADVLVFAQGADPRGLDPAYITDGESAKIITQIYEGLVRYQAGSTAIMPLLATEWQSVDDGKAWIFKLRRGVMFHDGTPFNAQAVQFSIERQLKPNVKKDMPYATFTYAGVSKVEVIDEYTVKVILDKPSASFLSNMAMAPSAPIVSPTAVQKQGDLFNENPVGTGPYRFVKWTKGQQVELSRFEGYWGEAAKIRQVVYRFIPENAVRAAELITGAADIIDGIDMNDVKILESKGMIVSKEPGMNINYLGFYTNRRPFDRLELRKIVSMAVNRQNLVDFLYQGYATLPNSPLPSFIPGYDKEARPYDYNPEEAKALLTKAGYANGLEFTAITYSNSRPYNPVNGEKLAAAVQADLARIGITMHIKAYPWTEYKQAYRNGEGDAFFLGWMGDNGDADNFLMLFETAQIPNGLNASRYSNPAYDRLLEQARMAPNPEKRAEYLAAAQQLIVRDAPWVFVSHSMNMAAYRPEVRGFSLHPASIHWLNIVEK